MRHAAILTVLALLVSCGEGESPVPSGPVAAATEANLQAGVAAVDITPPVGVPLAGYGGGGRRLWFPDLNPFDYHTFLKPSDGILDPIYAKALVLSDGTTKIALLSLDGVATVTELVDRIHEYAAGMGGTIARENLVVVSSHTHSGPGAVTSLTFWELLGVDLLVPSVRDGLAKKCALALVEAEAALEPARIGSALDTLPGVTWNRRSEVSPWIDPDMVDPELGVIRVDRADGTPMALVWNFAIHGTAYPSENLKYSADIMGAVSAELEATLGVTALFVNAAEGDIVPKKLGAEGIQELAPIMSAKIAQVFQEISTEPGIDMKLAGEAVDFGEATLDLSIGRALVGTPGLDPTELIEILGVDPGIVLPFPEGWVETKFRFQALRLNDALIVTIPGEAIHQLGLQIKQDAKELGFSKVMIFGLANGHMSYITTEEEYALGGYEGIATFFGPQTGEKVREACNTQMGRVKP